MPRLTVALLLAVVLFAAPEGARAARSLAPLGPDDAKVRTVAVQRLRRSRRLRQPPPALWRRVVRRRALDGTEALPKELVLHLLGFVLRPVQVASSLGGKDAALWQGDHHQPLRLGIEGVHILDVKFFPAGDRLVTAGMNGTAVIWSALTGRKLWVLRHHDEPTVQVMCVQAFPDGDRLVTLGTDGSAAIWSAEKGVMLRRVRFAGVCGRHRTVRVHPSGGAMITGVSYASGDPAVVWNAADGTVLHVLRQRDGRIRVLEMSPCGRTVVTADFTMVVLWDPVTGHRKNEISRPAGLFYRVAIANDGSQVFGVYDHRLFISNSRKSSVSTVSTGENIINFALLPGDRVVTFSEAQAVVWDIASGRRLRALSGGTGGVGNYTTRVTVSASGDIVAACGPRRRTYAQPRRLAEQWVRIWEVSTGRLLQAMSGSGSERCSISAGPGDSIEGLLLD